MGDIPEGCNALMRIDLENKEFSKENAKWFFAKAGQKGEKPQPKRQKKKHVENAITVCLRLNADIYNFINSQAMQKTIHNQTPFTANDMIREALSIAFPSPKQSDMFGGSK